MNELQTKKRRPSTYTAYRVEEPKPEREYDWDCFGVHFLAGCVVLAMVALAATILTIIVLVTGWYAPLAIGGLSLAVWLVWRLGRLAIGDF